MTTKETPHKKQTEVLTPAVIDFILALHAKFEAPRRKLLEARAQRAERIAGGEPIEFLSATESIRRQDWKVAEAPNDLQERRVEITGPAESKMIINALNCGAWVFMADLEDSLAPTWDSILSGHKALSEAVRKTLSFENEAGKNCSLDLNSRTTLVVRPRGLHMLEENCQIVDGGKAIPISA